MMPLTRISHQVATRMVKNNLFLSIYIDGFAAIAMIVPTRGDHIFAARLRNVCRRHGIQVGTIDALLAQLCISHKLVMLSTDRDFRHIAAYAPLRLWAAGRGEF